MSKRKRTEDSTSTTGSKKRKVTVTTFNKWKTQFERDHSTLSWLRCDVCKDDKTVVEVLWCEACRKYEDRITSMKNFSKAWISGSSNQKTSNIVDHATSEQHRAAMIRVRADAARASNQPLTSYSPIARSLLVMDEAVQGHMKKKFDICYVMAKEGLSFRKYTALHELEERHGVDLGFAYKTDVSAQNFIHYIAESQRQSFLEGFSNSNFYSFLMDGSTDAGNVEDELVLVQYCSLDAAAQEMRPCVRYLSLEIPKKADANGLIKCVGNALQTLGVDNILDQSSVLGVQCKPILIGGGTDGASVNIAEHNGMKGKLQRELPWLHWTWCYAHRLELACKDAFSSQLFKHIAEVLLQLYYLYAKSPKKSRELAEIAEDLKEVWELSKGGDRPVRSEGSRWINHKRKALQRLVERYGVYINHVATLSEDPTIKSIDRARLKGYFKKWKNSKVLIGAAMYVDVLKAPALLSLTLQGEKLDIVLGIRHLLKSSKSLKKMAGEDPLLWPTVKLVRNRVKEEGEDKVYQGAVLNSYTPATLQTCATQALADINRLDEKMRARLEWSDVTMLRAIIVFLDTQSWRPRSRSEDSDSDDEEDDLSEIKEAVECITSHFKEPLEAKGVTLANIQDEVEEVVPYARKYLSIGKEGYQKVWYNLHTAPDASKWPNILRLCELVFSLPFANGHVERMFSTMKVIKTNLRTNLKSCTLSDLLEIKVEGPPLASFSADKAVSLWWDDCKTTRRVNQMPRKEYRPRDKGESSGASSETPEPVSMIALDEWDSWFGPDATTPTVEELESHSDEPD